MEREKYSLINLDCSKCAERIEETVRNVDGVSYVSVSFATATLHIIAEDFEKVEKAIKLVEPNIEIQKINSINESYLLFDFWKELFPLLVSTFLFTIGLIFYNRLASTQYRLGEYVIFGAAYVVSGRGVLVRAFRDISKGRMFDENFLMTIATIGAIAIGEFPEAAGVMLFYNLGEFIQGLSVNRSRRSIRALLEIRPDKATLLRDGSSVDVQPDMVQIGDKILVKPGEKVPLDGEIVQGTSQIDTSPITGEAYPKVVNPGDIVLAGTINKSGLITIRVTERFNNSTIHRILELVEISTSRKAKTEKFITKFAKVYSPIVVIIAIGAAIIPPLFFGANFAEWLYRALVVLVISCPCALVISIPLGYFGGVGGASQKGILVKGSIFLDVLATVKTVVFDKTGTLTKGDFSVTKVIPRNGFNEDELVGFAVQAEIGSNHPIAESIRKYYGKSHEGEIEEFEEIAGQGIQTIIDGRVIIAGSDPLLHHKNIPHDFSLCNTSGTVVHVAVDNKYAGCLVISDELKDEATEAIDQLRANGVERFVMLTGDSQSAASGVADRLKLDTFKFGLNPEEKVTELEGLLDINNDTGSTAFVGDGINDAPSLARADVGIAMGALGSEAAIETADVVIMTDSLSKVAEAVKIGQKTRSVVWQNITLAIIVKGIFITFGILGEATMWQAVFGDMGVALLAVFNSTRAQR